MRLSLLLLVFLLAPLIQSQPRQIYRAEYNATTNHSDEGVTIAADGLGGCFVAGSAYSSSTGTYDAHLLAISSNGVPRWKFEDRVAGETESPSQVAIGTDRSVFMLTFVNRQGAATARIYRFTHNGSLIYSTELSRGSSTVNLEKAALHIDSHNNAYIGCGKNQQMYVAKLNSAGALQWQQSVGAAGDFGETTGITTDPAGNVYATGISSPLQGGFLTVKFDQNGNLQWSHLYTGPIGNTLGPSFIERQSNGDLIVCCTPEDTFGVPQYAVFKLNVIGQLLWQQPYNPQPTFDCEATAFTLDKDDNVIVTGFRLGGSADTVTVKYDKDGSRLWEANYTPSTGVSQAVGVDRFGRITIAGFLNSGSSTGLILFYDKNGNQLGVRTQARDSYDQISVDSKSNVFVVGSVFNQTTNSDFVFSKYSWLSPIFR